MALIIREDHDEEPKYSSTVETFFAPPPFTLPETIRKNIRDLVELQDLEWVQRHPRCERRELPAPTAAGQWGENCPRCFSEVPAYVTIGHLENALSLYQALGATPMARGEFAQTVGAAADRLKQTVADLDRMVANGWDQLFFVRDELARELPSLLRLLQTIDEVASAAADENITEDGAQVPHRDVLLVGILSEILTNGGLPCFLVSSEGKAILSPGMELLRLCLDQVGLHFSNDTMAKILLSTS